MYIGHLVLVKQRHHRVRVVIIHLNIRVIIIIPVDENGFIFVVIIAEIHHPVVIILGAVCGFEQRNVQRSNAATLHTLQKIIDDKIAPARFNVLQNNIAIEPIDFDTFLDKDLG